MPRPETPTPLYPLQKKKQNKTGEGSQTISDKLHQTFAYFRQFVFVRAKRIETNAISAEQQQQLWKMR